MSAVWSHPTESLTAGSGSPDIVPPKSPVLKPRARPVRPVPFLLLPPLAGSEATRKAARGQVVLRREGRLSGSANRR